MPRVEIVTEERVQQLLASGAGTPVVRSQTAPTNASLPTLWVVLNASNIPTGVVRTQTVAGTWIDIASGASSQAVTSVAGKTGAVTLTTSDISGLSTTLNTLRTDVDAKQAAATAATDAELSAAIAAVPKMVFGAPGATTPPPDGTYPAGSVWHERNSEGAVIAYHLY